MPLADIADGRGSEGGGGSRRSAALRAGRGRGEERGEATARGLLAVLWGAAAALVAGAPSPSQALLLQQRLVTRSRRLAPAGAPAKPPPFGPELERRRPAGRRRRRQEEFGARRVLRGAWTTRRPSAGRVLPRLHHAGPSRSRPWPAPRAGACLLREAGKALPAGSDLGTPRRAGPERGAAAGEAWHARGLLLLLSAGRGREEGRPGAPRQRSSRGAPVLAARVCPGAAAGPRARSPGELCGQQPSSARHQGAVIFSPPQPVALPSRLVYM